MFYGLERYRGVTGEMIFDPNAKNIAPLFLGTIHNGKAAVPPRTHAESLRQH